MVLPLGSRNIVSAATVAQYRQTFQGKKAQTERQKVRKEDKRE